MTGFGMAQIVDGVIVLTLLEGAALALHHRLSKSGVAPRDFGINLVSGLCLMLALRCALHDASATWIALWLMAAGLAHATDLRLRWQRGTSAGPHTEEVFR